MSKVKNEAKIKNPLIVAVREQLEHRATWLYLLCDEAQKRGLDPKDFGSAAVKRCGLMQGKGLVEKGKTDSLTGLRKTLFTKPAQWVFEMDIKNCTDGRYDGVLYTAYFESRTSNTEWHELYIPFENIEGTDDSSGANYLVLTATCSGYGDYFTGSSDSWMYIDDIELVY